ncbi:gp005R [Rabbit fibroma virus]|uniref:Ankyrin repeat protein T5 n=1 Tax=Rabbit fibroma virus (strain Kasza) TaxID=10272 RepID=VT5_RFVKA|nr:gp005L [Rabbit fibroma virus]NP_052044.1 gp005R [Rabbit fibroma virus]P25947.2 RecName: Full=Ankyrin repeat protein T5 [Rabbit fibroma virus (strain Kasza)]AAF17888.1 gp005L [Rabbit fibroma virus]AAF18037.1 gp005R [Rabbit fibroma virus]
MDLYGYVACALRLRYGVLDAFLNVYNPDELSAMDDTPFSLYLTRYDCTLETLRLFLKRGVDVNGVRGTRTSPLCTVLSNKELGKEAETLAMCLIDAGADVNARGADGRYPLLCLLENDRINTTSFVKYMIDRGTLVCVRGIDGCGPIQTYLRSKNVVLETLHVLVRAGASIHDMDKKYGFNILQCYMISHVRSSDVRILRFLAGQGVNSSQGFNATFMFDMLERKISYGVFNRKVLDFIFTQISVNQQDSLDFTPINYCVIHNDRRTFDYLLEKGANPNVVNFLGNSCLDLAVLNGNKYMTLRLLRKTITPDAYARALKVINYNIYSINSFGMREFVTRHRTMYKALIRSFIKDSDMEIYTYNHIYDFFKEFVDECIRERDAMKADVLDSVSMFDVIFGRVSRIRWKHVRVISKYVRGAYGDKVKKILRSLYTRRFKTNRLVHYITDLCGTSCLWTHLPVEVRYTIVDYLNDGEIHYLFMKLHA